MKLSLVVSKFSVVEEGEGDDRLSCYLKLLPSALLAPTHCLQLKHPHHPPSPPPILLPFYTLPFGSITSLYPPNTTQHLTNALC